jgi:hypothetical protein
VPGPYSACIIPITGDMNDPKFAQRLQENVESLGVHCRPVTVATTPTEQQVTIAVPAMEPLPG